MSSPSTGAFEYTTVTWSFSAGSVVSNPTDFARGVKGFFPDSWSQATAEIVAFAMPMAGRAAINRAYAAIGSGPVNATGAMLAQLKGLSTVPGAIIDAESGRPGDREFVGIRETGSREAAELRQRMGNVEADLRAAPGVDDIAANLAEVAKAQGDGAASTYAKRFALCNAFNIVIERDTDAALGTDARAEGEIISPEQVATLREQIEEAQWHEAGFLKLAGVEKLEDVRSGSYPVLMRAIQAKKAQAKKGATP